MNGLALTALKQILIMFFLIVTGIICYRVKLIDKDTNKRFSDLLLMLVSPFVIIVSYQRKYESKLLTGLLISMLLAIAAHVTAILISKLVIRGKKHIDNSSIERFAIIYSNNGFIGIPLVYGIFGSTGVFYLTASMTVSNLFVWTHGVILMTGKKDLKTVLKAFLSPTVIATFLGFIFFMTRVSFPGVLNNSFHYIADMNTPLAMLVSGATIAQADLKKVFTKFSNYYVAFFKLFMVPVLLLLIFSRFPMPKEVLLTALLAASCPTAASVSLFALHYGKNYIYAGEIFTVSTILSILSIPLVMMIAGYIA